MKATPSPARKPVKAKAKAKRASSASQGSAPAAKSKSRSKPTPKPAARDAKASPKPRKSEAVAAAPSSASQVIDQRIRDLGGWRGETLARMRKLIVEADPEMIEECKWAKANNPLGVPVWSHDGIVCTGETYKNVVKLTFARGAAIADPSRLFNSSLEGNTRRAIDIQEGQKVDAAAFKALVKAAVAENAKSAKKR